MQLPIVLPNWPAPPGVRVATTTRRGGISAAPFDTFNLAAGIGDSPAAVAENRSCLTRALRLPEAPRWLKQVHGTRVVDAQSVGEPAATPSAGAPADPPVTLVEADAIVARHPGPVCVVLTADCIPVVISDRNGSRVAIAHAGWRGLAAGVLETTVAALGGPSKALIGWLGPGIGVDHYEVSDDVRDVFLAHAPDDATAFVPSPPGCWLADLFELARRRLHRAGVVSVYGGEHCTFSDPDRFYSYRRDGATGRIATIAWIEPTDGVPSQLNHA